MALTGQAYRIGNSSVRYYFSGSVRRLRQLVSLPKTILITDERVFKAHRASFKGWNTIVLKAGEEYKIQATADAVLEQLVQLGADRKSCLVGIGGGVITDLTGYVASIYMRGISFGFVPTSLLAMVDASIGGKNGINIGIYKNMVGTIRQPEFILFDPQLLTTLPDAEWKNGFAEIIKHACIRDARMFVQLEKKSLSYYQRRPKVLLELIRRNALLKTRVVQRDEWEQGERRLLNFGHTLGHALENTYELSHGQAISIGMTYATELSQHLLKFSEGGRVLHLLQQYGLPTYAQFNVQKVLQVLQKDKKKVGGVMNYILLKKLGKGVVHPIPMVQFSSLVRKITKVT